MKRNIYLIIASFLFLASSAYGFDMGNVKFLSDLKLGDFGPEVSILQRILNADPDTIVAKSGPGSSGNETEYFGFLTRLAVIKFQNKYKSDILIPVGLSVGTGYVGKMTIGKLNNLIVVINAGDELGGNLQTGNTSSVIQTANQTPTTTPKINKPIIMSIYPSRVRMGGTVIITGENFTATGNTIMLGDGYIIEYFRNLPSNDGKTISFVYQPPEVATMTEAQIRALPKQTVDQIEAPIKAVGKTLADALAPYQGMNNETDLRGFLQKNGHSIDELYNNYFIQVENANGSGISKTALLWGMRKIALGNGLIISDSYSFLSALEKKIESFVKSVTPSAQALGLSGGGFNSGILMYCTCATGYLTFMTDYAGGGSGLYWFPPGFKPNAGTGIISSMWLGGYIKNGGVCVIGVEPYCISISANMPMIPWGASK
ncbi:MAG: peptidoglycan-binding domain-containing protein [Candidatus Paceibacterota bacterium]